MSLIFVKICLSYAPFELRILEIHSFPHFSHTYFDIFSWNLVYDFSCYKPRIKFECCHFPSIFVWVMPLFELRTLEIHGFPHFSPTCFDIFNWNFVYDFVWTTDQVWMLSLFSNFFEQVMLFFELRILAVHSFPHFSLTCFGILSWNFVSYFVFMNYKSSSSVIAFC